MSGSSAPQRTTRAPRRLSNVENVSHNRFCRLSCPVRTVVVELSAKAPIAGAPLNAAATTYERRTTSGKRWQQALSSSRAPSSKCLRLHSPHLLDHGHPAGHVRMHRASYPRIWARSPVPLRVAMGHPHHLLDVDLLLVRTLFGLEPELVAQVKGEEFDTDGRKIVIRTQPRRRCRLGQNAQRPDSAPVFATRSTWRRRDLQTPAASTMLRDSKN